MYLLDTHILSELRRPKPHGAVVAWMKSVPEQQLFVSAVSLGGIQASIELARDQDPLSAEALEHWADQVADSHQVLPMDTATFRIWARLMHRRSDTLYEDAMIAATAQRHGLTVATRNVSDFLSFGVTHYNPFDGKSG